MLVKKSNLNIIKPQLPVTNYQFKRNTLDREEPAKHYHEDVIIKNPEYRNSLGQKTQFPQQILCKEKKKEEEEPTYQKRLYQLNIVCVLVKKNLLRCVRIRET